MSNVLVVSTVDHPEDVLRSTSMKPTSSRLSYPSTPRLPRLARQRREGLHSRENVAENVAAELPGETIEAMAGEADVDLAIRDALATFPADEIMVAVRPGDQEGTVESHATANAPTRSLHGIPVRYVVIRE